MPPENLLSGVRSGSLDVLDCLLHSRLDRCGNFFDGLRCYGLKLLGLARDGLCLLADESGLELDDLTERLDAEQSFDMSKTGFRVGAQSSQRLQRDCRAIGLCGLEGGFECLLGCFSLI